MGDNTKIEWCEHTFNPWWGCTKVSPACGMPLKGHENEPHGNCYADSFSNRLGFKIWGQDARRRFFDRLHWQDLIKWNKAAEKAGVPARVFCGSMCDIMEDRRDLDCYRDLTFSYVVETQWLIYMFLTKRPQNFRRLFPDAWVRNGAPMNVWPMTTVESADYLWRIDELKSVPATIHGLSVEPLLGPMPTLGEYLDGIDFVIVGGESGPGARPMHPDWARSVRDQCISTGVSFFFKQWGEFAETGPMSVRQKIVCSSSGDFWDETEDGADDRHWRKFHDGNSVNLPPHQVMYRVGKKASGRLLDGREWNEMPEVRR